MAIHLLIGLGSAPGVGALWLALLLTWSVHAAAWAGAAALVVRSRSLSTAAQHSCWKLALFGPLVTALLAAALGRGGGPDAGRAACLREIPVLSLPGAPAPGGPRAVAPTGASASEGASASDRRASQGWALLTVGAAAATALGLLRYAGSALLLRRGLRGRRGVRSRRLLRRLERLRVRAGLGPILLTASRTLGSPLVIGASEICIPAAKIAALDDAEVDAVLAHELAHLERRDGLWFPLVGLVQAALWGQPLVHWLATRFRQSAELACDDRAVELTGDPAGLARALVEVAAGAHGGRGSMVPAMARSASLIVARVRRLAQAASQPRPQPSPRASWRALAVLASAGLVAAGLSVRVARAAPGPAPGEPRVVLAPVEASDAAALGRQVAELTLREQQLEAQLQAALAEPCAQAAEGDEPPQVLELRQQLRHARAARSWIEERLASP